MEIILPLLSFLPCARVLRTRNSSSSSTTARLGAPSARPEQPVQAPDRSFLVLADVWGGMLRAACIAAGQRSSVQLLLLDSVTPAPDRAQGRFPPQQLVRIKHLVLISPPAGAMRNSDFCECPTTLCALSLS